MEIKNQYSCIIFKFNILLFIRIIVNKIIYKILLILLNNKENLCIIKQSGTRKHYTIAKRKVKIVIKPAHSANLIGLSHHTSTTFFTSSEDATVRLWDIRTQSSIKLIRNKCLSSELSNPATDYNNSIFVGSQKLVYEFDIRK